MSLKPMKQHNIDRTRSAPPDQGEPDLKESKAVKLNVDAPAFSFDNKPNSKNLSAAAADFSPSFSIPSLTPNSGLRENVPDFVPSFSFTKAVAVIEEVKKPELKLIEEPKIESVSDEDTDEPMGDLWVVSDFELTKAKCRELDGSIPTDKETLFFKYDVAFIRSVAREVSAQALWDRTKALKLRCSIENRTNLNKIDRNQTQPVLDTPESVAEWRAAKSEEEKMIAEKAKLYTARRNATVEETELIKKKIKINLNKLTPNNKDKLQVTLLEVAKTCHEALRELTVALFDKAWSEQKYSSLYALICQFLKENFEGFAYPGEEASRNWFKHELLTMCQEVFEYRPQDIEFQGLTDDKIEQKRVQLKKKTIGNVRFIGELFKVNLISPKIVLNCIDDLLISQQASLIDEDKLEGACVLLTTGGSMFERSSLREHTDRCMMKVQEIIRMPLLTPRLKFLLMNVEDARKTGWAKSNVDQPRKVEEIRAEFVKEHSSIGYD
mmetsp:Transcript_27503/g.49538  ORF Transcript_27503/g.49538 Transcript_27503/m.49538 type:complete len:495 (+) Transcript_27503:201-1685(+)